MSRLLFAAPHKSTGKTTLSLGIAAALKQRGLAVQPFKKGPDYIDPMWLGLAAGRPCYNLDFHTQGDDELIGEVARRDADITLIEGNMGLFDSLDVEGRGSNAALAVLLDTPVVLVLDARGATRSLVPLILGFQAFEPQLNIVGLILNQVGGPRHEMRLREAIGHYCDLPILGAVHRDERLAIDERHLGLTPSNEAAEALEVLERIRDIVAERIDLDALLELAGQAPALPRPEPVEADGVTNGPRIGISRDAAFGFYYPGDLEALERHGAELVPIDTLGDEALPENLDGLLLGGGFPETQAAALAANAPLRAAIKAAIEGGLPTYAECGGLMYLCRAIEWNGERHEMVGVIPAEALMEAKPQGRGYVELEETAHTPWPLGGGFLPAHEFHYSRLRGLPEPLPEGFGYAYKLKRGSGIDGRHDGLVYKNLLANYCHLRDVQGNHWTERFIEFILRRKKP